MQSRCPVLCSPCSFGFKHTQQANTDVLAIAQVGVPTSHASNTVIIVKCGNCSRCDLNIIFKECSSWPWSRLSLRRGQWPVCQHLNLAAKYDRTAWHSEGVI